MNNLYNFYYSTGRPIDGNPIKRKFEEEILPQRMQQNAGTVKTQIPDSLTSSVFGSSDGHSTKRKREDEFLFQTTQKKQKLVKTQCSEKAYKKLRDIWENWLNKSERRIAVCERYMRRDPSFTEDDNRKITKYVMEYLKNEKRSIVDKQVKHSLSNAENSAAKIEYLELLLGRVIDKKIQFKKFISWSKENFLKSLSYEELLKHIPAEELLKHIPAEELLQNTPGEELLSRIDKEKLWQSIVNDIDKTIDRRLTKIIDRETRQFNTLKIILYSTCKEPLTTDEMKDLLEILESNKYKGHFYADGCRKSLLKTLFVDFDYFQYEPLFDFLISRNCDVNEKDLEGPFPGNTILHWIVANARWDMANKFISLVQKSEIDNLNIDFQSQDRTFKNNPLSLGLKKGPRHDAVGWEKLISRLIQHTLDLNKTDKNGNTPLHIAALRRHAGFVTELINNDADPKIRNKNNQLPADLWKMDVQNLDQVENILDSVSEKMVTFDLKERDGILSTPPQCLPQV